MTERVFSCADCAKMPCRSRNESQYPKFCLTAQVAPELKEQALAVYNTDEELGEIARVSAGVECEFYGRMNRVEETIEFIKRMGYKKIGVASCVGLMAETKIFCEILRGAGIDYYVVACKIGAVDKGEIGIPPEQRLNGGCAHESMCNPVLQAKALAAAGTEFNVVIGLCVGHDSLFLQTTQTPCTVLIVKDRALAHNPAAALYTAKSGFSHFKKELNL